MKKPLIYTIATILTVLVLLLAAPFFIPWTKYKDMAIAKVAAASGYYLTIDGGISGGFVPMPHVTLEKIAVANAQNAEAFVRADSISVSVALWPLLSGNVQIGAITLDKPVAQLITRADKTTNWQANKPTPAAVDANAGADTAASKPSAVSIGKITINNGDITLTDAAKPAPTKIIIPTLSAHVPSLQGPFGIKGDVVINNIPVTVDANLGDITQDNFDVKGDVAIAGDALQASVDGTLGLKPTASGSLDIAAKIRDVAALNAVGVVIPSGLQGMDFTGKITVKDEVANLENGTIDSPLAKANVNATLTGLTKAPRNIVAAIDFREALNVDALLKVLPKTKTASVTYKSGQALAADKPATKPAGFLPDNLNLPKDMTAKIKVTAPAISYGNKLTGALDSAVDLQDSKTLLANVAVATLPGGGEFKATGGLNGNALAMDYNLSVTDLRSVLVDWLKVVKADVYANPAMPKNINSTGTIKIAGPTANIAFDRLIIGDTTAHGAVAYTKATPRDNLGVTLRADSFNLANPNSITPSSGDQAVAPNSVAANPVASAGKIKLSAPSLPELPFDVVFDVTLGALNTDTLTLRDITAVGKMAGQAISLTNFKAGMAGGQVAAQGQVADVQTLRDVDLTASLNTPDIRAFTQGLPTKVKLPETLKGPVAASVKLLGSRMGMQVDARIQALGFNASAKGNLADVLNPILPGSLSVAIAHPDFDQALRQFAPSINSQTTGGMNVTADVKLDDKIYTFSQLKAKLGGNDLNGQLKIATSPLAISGDLASSVLNIGQILGVTGTPKQQSADSGQSVLFQSVQATTGAPWSNTPLPLAALKGLNSDLNLSVGTLTYGTWRLSNATFGVKLNDGNLNIAPFKAGLFGGTLDMKVTAKASDVLSVSLHGQANNVQLGAFVAALSSQSREKLRGLGSIDFDVQGAGATSASLVRGLNGKLGLTTKDMSVLGIDLEKLGAAVDAATGDGWQGALAAGVSGGLSGFGLEGGSTGFKDINHTFPITNGVVNIADLKLDTRNALVRTTSNGQVNFPNFAMDIGTDIFAVKASRAVANIRLSGPLNAPTKKVNSDALQNLLGSKVQKQLDKVIGSDKVQNLLNKAPGLGGLLGITKPADPAPATDPAPAATDAAPPTTPEPTAQPQEKVDPVKELKQQAIEGLFNQFGR